MLLNRVVISGFKSFADKVEFDFGPGVTCIVGPNGCGKSNVVDAVKWVLGEQSARSLRGRQMIDMIFSGSIARGSSSVAQVELVFDNADRRLPVDLEQVTITRKLYRSGESEYLLNNETARLKDIRELFMDTGIGIDAYSVIEQGKVDILLQSSPTERRVIFEEAAGISKYKARKKEAQRKLERTEQNLLRVADIVEELEKRLRSVKLQAGKARNFLEYEARLNELKASYSMAEYHRLTVTVEQLRREAQSHGDEATALKTAIDRHESQEVEISSRLDRLAEDISETDSQLIRAKTEVTTFEERIAAAASRMEEQQSLLNRSAERQHLDVERMESTQQELARVEALAVDLQQQKERLQESIDEHNERDRTLARDITQAQAMLEDEKAGIIELLRKSAQTHNEIIRLNTHRESLVGQKGRLSARDAQIRAELEESLGQKAQFKQRLTEVEDLIQAENAKLDEKKTEAARVHAMRQRLVDELASAKERRSASQSRRELLRDLEEKREGLGAGVRRVLEVKESEDGAGAFDCVRGLVADFFETDVTHAKIIEAVLGESDQYLVVADSAAFLSGLAALGELEGRVTALCMDRLPPLVNERDFSGQPGFVARALDLVRFGEEAEELARHLLGKTVVVESVEAARAIARLDVASHRFVTLSGRVIEPDGRISVGPPSSRAGLISRKSELRDLDVQMVVVDETIVKLADQLNRCQAEVGHLDRIQQELRTAIYESNTAKVEANAALQNIEETIHRLTDEQPLIAREVALIEQQIGEVLEKSEEGGKSLEAMERENEQRERVGGAHQQRIDEIVTARRRIQEDLTEQRVCAGQLTEKRAAAAETINGLRRQLRELQEAVEAARRDQEQYKARIQDARDTVESGQLRLSALAGSIESLEGAANRLRQQREMLRVEIETLGQSVKAARTQLEEAEAKQHATEMSLAETNVRRDELSTRVEGELGINLAQRYEEYEYTEQDWDEVETQIAELRGKIERLGNVNLDAIDELEELQQRHGFLTGQRDDLTQSFRQLEQLIDKLNTESHARFKASFDQIREHFRTLFRKLFGGGRADIVLEDPENVLECGIEILAQPPGKELQSISLMSGGEKTMTAIALLMSIFKSRPAPFAILDEVDAALDEANNDRFNQIVREFVRSSQFILITHSKRTMNVADRLYGVTMQEPGVSTLVSVQLADTHVA